MTDPRQRLIEAWLDAGPEAGPADGLSRSLEVAFAGQQRAAWLTTERWIGARSNSGSYQGRGFSRMVLLLVALALIAVAFALGVAVGSRPRIPPPIGPTANGLLAVDGNFEISLMNSDGSNRRTITPPDALDVNPVWSPDGQHIGFTSWPLEGPRTPSSIQDLSAQWSKPVGSIVVTDADGQNRQAISQSLVLWTDGLAVAMWSHDGSRIAYSEDLNGTPTIDVVRLDGTLVARIAPGDAATWSPDDTELAFRREGVGIFVAAADGTGEPRQITSTSGSGYAFADSIWSNDGRSLAYVTGPDGAHDVHLVHVDGSDDIAIAATSANEFGLGWSPDGSRFAIQRVIDPGGDVVFVIANSDGTSPRVLRTGPLSGQSGGGWSPDGRYFVGFAVPPDPRVGIDSTALLIDPATGSIVARIDGPANEISWQRTAP